MYYKEIDKTHTWITCLLTTTGRRRGEDAEWLFRTDGSRGTIFLRLAIGSVDLPHGAQKVLDCSAPGYKRPRDFYHQDAIPVYAVVSGS